MTQLEFYKSFQFVFELIIAELLYVYKLPRKPHFALRLTGAVAAAPRPTLWRRST